MTLRVKNAIRATVIIPAYKAADTLAKAVQSALDQTEKNIEVIIIDDGSPDDNRTWQVTQAIAESDPRVRAIRLPENRGKPYAVNHATQQAQGEWIAILDSDDWYEAERLERLINAAEAAGVEMAADNQMFFDSKANAYAGTALPQHGTKLLDLDSFLQGSDPTARYDYGMLKPVFRASFIREHKIDYYEPAHVSEDFYILLCFFAAGGKAVVLDEPLYIYVQPFGGISREWSQEGRKPYDFTLMKEVNDHFMEVFTQTLSPAHMRRLAIRGRGIKAMFCFHRIRECVRAGNVLGATKLAFTAPPRLWGVVADRIFKRIARSF